MIAFGLPVFWGWMGLGLILIALEVLLAPGSYLLWVGLAALAMALLATVVSFSLGGELATFGAVALLFGLAGWKVYGARSKDDAARDLHDLTGGLMGREFVLSQPIVEGVGQVRIADSVWRVAGPDLAVGSKVRVRGLDGATLLVDPA